MNGNVIKKKIINFFWSQTNALEDELERRTLTFTAWNQSNDKTNKQAWHPFRFGFSDAIPQRILEIKVVLQSVQIHLKD